MTSEALFAASDPARMMNFNSYGLDPSDIEGGGSRIYFYTIK